jgi:mono/diheme cytochrome c family protein
MARARLAWLALGLLAGGAGCMTSHEAGVAVPVDPTVLYSQNCARCHGADGRGDAEMKKTMPTLRDFTDPAFKARSPDDLARVVMAGKNQMPGFGASLSQTKIQHLVGYVRRFAGAP